MKHAIKLFIMITFFSKLFGCTTDNKNKKQETQTKEISTKKTISIDEINKANDEDLLYLIFDIIAEKLPYTENEEEEYVALRKLNKEQQAFYLVWCLEGEVNNGGYNQFYYNSTGKYFELLPDALELIGATKHSELMRRANKIFIIENKKITQEQDGTLEGFSKSYEDNPLDIFDQEFADLEEIENLEELQIKLVRKNKEKFIN